MVDDVFLGVVPKPWLIGYLRSGFEKNICIVFNRKNMGIIDKLSLDDDDEIEVLSPALSSPKLGNYCIILVHEVDMPMIFRKIHVATWFFAVLMGRKS